MSMTRRTIDVEDALQAALNADGYRASAPPIPRDLGSSLPYVLVRRTGGYENGMVQDMHLASIHVYAEDDAQAMHEADALTAWVRALAGHDLGGVPCYVAAVSTLPYGNPDPDRPELARCTIGVQLLTRTAHD